MVHGLIAGALTGFAAGTLGEYVMHRFMHRGVAMRRVHGRHHLLRVGQGVLGELVDYGRGGTLPALAIGATLAWPLGAPTLALGFLGGAAVHIAFAAYSHQLQHEKPHLVFWMRKPVHFLHHDRHMWESNFGISTDVWDHVFGTYEDAPWQPTRRGLANPWREFFTIDWGSPPKFDRKKRQAWERSVLARQRADGEHATSRRAA